VHGLARLPLAGEPGVHGIHLPERDATDGGLAARTGLGARALVGMSRHDASGLTHAAPADYATLAPVFAVPGKGPPLGVAALRAACERSPLPVVALGGLTPARAAECRAAGAAAVAVMSYLWRGDVGENVRRMLEGGDRP
jgi:thiamine-phosphate pyrophosphorylase